MLYSEDADWCISMTTTEKARGKGRKEKGGEGVEQERERRK